MLSATPTGSMATARNEDEEDNYIRDERRHNMLSGRPAEGVGSAPLEPQKFQHSCEPLSGRPSQALTN